MTCIQCFCSDSDATEQAAYDALHNMKYDTFTGISCHRPDMHSTEYRGLEACRGLQHVRYPSRTAFGQPCSPAWTKLGLTDSWSNMCMTRPHGQSNMSLCQDHMVKVRFQRPLRTGKVCSNCKTTETSLWRRDKVTDLPLCNACGIYMRDHGVPRPAPFRSGRYGMVARKRQRVVYEASSSPS